MSNITVSGCLRERFSHFAGCMDIPRAVIRRALTQPTALFEPIRAILTTSLVTFFSPPPTPSMLWPKTKNMRFQANSSYKGKSMQQRLKGQKLGPNDPPLEPGMFLTNFNEDYPTTLEVTEIGDILITAGFFPNSTKDTLWEHRSTGPSGVHVLGCALEAFWQRARKGGETRVSLSIKNGRWRVGRGKMCTLARSPAPEGSLRRFLPWDERGKAVIEASLYMVRNGHATIFSGTEVMWSSFLEMIKAKEDEGMGE